MRRVITVPELADALAHGRARAPAGVDAGLRGKPIEFEGRMWVVTGFESGRIVLEA